MPTPPNPCKAAALEYLERGFSIIPIRPKDKKPPKGFSWKKFQKQRATPDEVEDWFRKWPDANIALVTGAISGVAVVDGDGPEGIAWMKANLPRTSVYQKTGKGFHAFFATNGQPVKSVNRILPEIDVKANGGYVLLNPSIHPSGKQYELVFLEGMGGWDDLSLFPHDKVLPQDQPAGPFKPIFEKIVKPGRNNALTQMVGRWFGKKLEFNEVLLMAQAWNRDHCSPPLSGKDVNATVNSIFKRESKKIDEIDDFTKFTGLPEIHPKLTEIDRIHPNSPRTPQRFEGNLTAEIEEWIKNSRGCFTVADVDREFGLILRSDKQRRTQALKKMVKNNTILRDRRVSGKYHILDTTVEWVDITTVEDSPFPLNLPLGLDKLVVIPPKAIIIVAGTTNSGKTTLLLNILQANFDQTYPMVYLMSEMGRQEYTSRVRPLVSDPHKWTQRVKASERSEGFDGIVMYHNPNGLTIIDYLEEIEGEYYKIASDIRRVYDALSDGACIIALQKKGTSTYAMGGEATAQKARLYLSLDTLLHQPGCSVCALKIVKCKSYLDRNPNGLERHFKIIRGHRIEPLSGWMYCNDKQREQFIKRYEQMLDTETGEPK